MRGGLTRWMKGREGQNPCGGSQCVPCGLEVADGGVPLKVGVTFRAEQPGAWEQGAVGSKGV